MDEPTLPLPGLRVRHALWLLLLLVCASGLRVWQLNNTEVATRDSIAYIRQAWRFGGEPFATVVRTSEHHPGYAWLIHLASGPVRAALPDDLPRAMQLSAQLVAALAGVLLVVPMYFLGCELFDRRIAFWATLLFQVLPASGRLLPDGLSDPPFLLFAAVALLAGCKAVRTGRWPWFAAAGLASGLAYLIRTEGLLLAGVTGLVMLLLHANARWGRTWRTAGCNGVALSVSTLAVALPFMLLIGGISLKPSAGNMIVPGSGHKVAEAVHTPMPLAVWNFGPEVRPEDRYGWAAYALVTMLDKGFFHALTLPFLASFVLFRRRYAEVPGLWVVLALTLLLMALLYRLGQSNGYLGERHVMLIVMSGMYGAVASVAVFAGWLGRRIPRVPATTWAMVFLCGIVMAAMPKTLTRLHGERIGFRQAGEWLAANMTKEDVVFDPFAWSSYFAGRAFVSGPPKQPDPNQWPEMEQKSAYVVLDESRSQHEHLWYILGPAAKVASKGEVVQTFAVKQGKHRSVVKVYRVTKNGERSASTP